MNLRYILTLGLGLTLFTSIGQVGIGTVNPDPSSILDVVSNSQGFLAPRLTTSERLDIDSPADGLMVYDTDLKGIYVFNGTTWISTVGAKTRDNYVLVKSVDDLPEPNNGKITLQAGWVYEINGTINVTNKIALNNATIVGRELYEDVLVNNTSGALFECTSGGSIENVSLYGNGANALFDLNGSTGSERIVLNRIFVVGFGTLGKVENFDLIIIQDVSMMNNSDGYTFKDINHFNMINSLFLYNNTGTLMTLEGKFKDIGFLGGVVEIENTVTGLDVQNLTEIERDAFIAGVSVSGDGLFVRGTPSNKWDIDSPGLVVDKDEVASADLHFDIPIGDSQTTSVSSNNPSKINGTTSSMLLKRFETQGNNKLVYKGLEDRFFNVSVTGAFQPSNAKTYVFYIAKNGVVDQYSRTVARAPSGFFISDEGILGFSITSHLSLAPDDYIEVFVECRDSSGSIELYSLTLIIN